MCSLVRSFLHLLFSVLLRMDAGFTRMEVGQVSFPVSKRLHMDVEMQKPNLQLKLNNGFIEAWAGAVGKK